MSNTDYIKDAFIKGIHCSRDKGGPRDPRSPAKLWARDLGTKCLRKLWFETNNQEAALPIDTETASKFILGDSVEVIVKEILRAGGANVHSEQDRVEINYGDFAVSGRIDFMVDDIVVEVKSINEWGFRRIVKRGSYVDYAFDKCQQPTNFDPYGYFHQLSFYMAAKGKINGMLLIFNKSTGEAWFEDFYGSGTNKATGYKPEYFAERAKALYAAASKGSWKDLPAMPLVAYGANEGLGSPCTYCPFKFKCYPGLRVFNYADKHTYLTLVNKVPKVPEITEDYLQLVPNV